MLRSPGDCLDRAKKLVIVEGGTHMGFYDVPEYVERAVAGATPFFKENLV
jgi:fermentation-respiration switch protein FrsA (DUF1100 family)